MTTTLPVWQRYSGGYPQTQGWLHIVDMAQFGSENADHLDFYVTRTREYI
jgi:hypothetical protein